MISFSQIASYRAWKGRGHPQAAQLIRDRTELKIAQPLGHACHLTQSGGPWSLGFLLCELGTLIWSENDK